MFGSARALMNNDAGQARAAAECKLRASSKKIRGNSTQAELIVIEVAIMRTRRTWHPKETILELLSGSLRFAGFEVMTAASGAEALRAAAASRPDLVLLDVMMPR
jgi:PleD family two-component response regulator